MHLPHPQRRASRLTRVVVTFATISSLALTTPAMVSAQTANAVPNTTEQAPEGSLRLGSQPPIRTDTTLNAAPMPVDAADTSMTARSREVDQHEITAQAWTKRPPANRSAVEPPNNKWSPTIRPKSRVTPSQMRSDREEIPEGYTKAEADKAETMEAALIAQRSGIGIMAAPGCQVYWPAPFEVCGAIRDKYNALGGPNSFLLFPKTNELTNPDGIGRRTEFQNGPIYWSPQGGAHPVVNTFLAGWADLGYENSYVGYPTTDEILNPDGLGRRQHFTGATMYWHPSTPFRAYSVGGAIAGKWHSLGAEQGSLGYPISHEEIMPDGVGRANHFQNGSIYWHPATGAHDVHGDILADWATNGYETGWLGYPTASRELIGVGEYRQNFQGGYLLGSDGSENYSTISNAARTYHNLVIPCLEYDFPDTSKPVAEFTPPIGRAGPIWLSCYDLRYHQEKHFYDGYPDAGEWIDFNSCVQRTFQVGQYFMPENEGATAWGWEAYAYLGQANSWRTRAVLFNQRMRSAHTSLREGQGWQWCPVDKLHRL